MSSEDQQNAEVPVEEVLTAQQALVLVCVVLATALFYAYRWYKKSQANSDENTIMDYEFVLPEEKAIFMNIYKQKPEDKKENMAMLQEWRKALMQVHFKRVLKVIALHEQVEAAKRLVEREVQECGQIANQLQPNWGRTIFQEAYKMKEAMDAKNAQVQAQADKEAREKREAELMRQAKELQEKEEELLRKRAEEDLLKETKKAK